MALPTRCIRKTPYGCYNFLHSFLKPGTSVLSPLYLQKGFGINGLRHTSYVSAPPPSVFVRQQPSRTHHHYGRWTILMCFTPPLLFYIWTERRRRKQRYIDLQNQHITDYVYFDLAKGDRYLGRMLIGLFGASVPCTVNNFLQLVKGHRVKDKLLGYRNTLLHAVIPGKLIAGGDVVTGKGSDSLSIYGPMFPDESFFHSFCRKGDIAMFSRKPHGNGSAFLIALRPLTEENGRFVVFGTIVEGHDLLSLLAADVNPNRKAIDFARSIEPIKIVSCGVYEEGITDGPPSFIADKEQNMERKITFSTGHAHQPLSDVWHVSQFAMKAAENDIATDGQHSQTIQKDLRQNIRPFIRDRRHDLYLQATPEERLRMYANATERVLQRTNHRR